MIHNLKIKGQQQKHNMFKRRAHRKHKDTSRVYRNIKDHYDINTNKRIKNYQRITQHMTKLSEATKFLERCGRTGLTPNFIDNATKNILYIINNNTSNKALPTKITNSVSKFIKNVQTKLLNLLIKIKHELLGKKEKEVNILKTQINQQLNTLDSTTFFESENLLTKKLAADIKKTQTNKYEKLKDKQKQLLNIKGVPGWFCNTSTTQISNDIQWLLSLGPRFASPTSNKEFPLFQFIADGENCIQTIKIKKNKKSKETT
ncbi:PREDICTED: uncharacterized protein LOC108377642 [Rhagoletis zephyria]|uniref:uncharacterized protein LOC108377642 n=1 Tax=Rhagoletis zephyria TaxID=28612 RepID=UPI0008113C40|nr:PREDICTED: uncharacterized protein LOC108377642 [Rhagoletis zephyria]